MLPLPLSFQPDPLGGRDWLADPVDAFARLPSKLRDRIDRQLPRAIGCWLWLGPIHYNGRSDDRARGYGRQSWRRDLLDETSHTKNWLAHKLIYELLIGPVPHKLVLDHLKERCSSRRCVRPDHVEPVTHAVNVIRGGGRWGYKVFKRAMCAQQEVPF